MSQALVLVDLQRDFAARPGLSPSPGDLALTLAPLVQYARANGIPVLHVRTAVTLSPDTRMPHWQANDTRECISDTDGAAPLPAFAELAGEPVITKRFFSGFGNPALDQALRERGIEALWIAGLYTQSCVRATALDAYERGYRVTLVSDCLGSTEPLHAGITLQYLDGRAARLQRSTELLGTHPPAIEHYCPDTPATLASRVDPTPHGEIASIAGRAALAARAWAAVAPGERRALVARFAGALRGANEDLLRQIVRDIGKPASAAQQELDRAVGHVEEAARLADRVRLGANAEVRFEPHGAVAVITPWNNPVAIAVGKIAAALALGNAVVWKPAAQAANITTRLLALLQASGAPGNLVQVVNGGPAEAGSLAANRHIAAVSLTGPEQAGMAMAAACLPRGKPLQAELGGNNALLVLEDADIEALAPAWALFAFGCAGQRCTAIRRFVVVASVLPRFERAMTAAIASLQLRSPQSTACQVGPMISPAARARAATQIQQAVSRGARIVCRGADSGHDADAASCYLAPVLLAGLDDGDRLVQEETFAPVAVVQAVSDFAQGIECVNGVRQGLLAGIATASRERYEQFANDCEAGIVIDGAGLPLHPGAPFGGRKVSQIGPPEHGAWDREFFARPKTLYRTT